MKRDTEAAVILVATVGTARYEEVEYYLEASPQKACRTRYAPVATAELLGGVTEALVLVTQEAEQKHWPALIAEFQKRGIGPAPLVIPLARSEAEIAQVVSLLCARVSTGSEVILDITYAFRHLPVLMLSALAYLTAERDVRLQGIYYGAYEAQAAGRVPVFDLTPFLTLTECYHAIRQFRETGDARRLAAYLKQLNSRLWKQEVRSPDLSSLVGALENLSAAMVTPLPIEAGLYARSCLRYLEFARDHIAPHDSVARSLLDALRPTLELFAPGGAAKHKSELPLDLAELQRQLRVIRFAVDAQAPDRALLLLREWIVSRCLLAAGVSAGWLDYHNRRERLSRNLSAIAQRIQVDRNAVPDATHKLSSIWERIAARRNMFAHAGMNQDCHVNPQCEMERVAMLLRECESRCEEDSFWRIDAGAARTTLLITPLGLSPGVLYSALIRCPADDVLVISSAQGAAAIPDICAKAGRDPAAIALEIVDDPHRCFDTTHRLVSRVRASLLRAAEVILNVTGGTTAMQYVVERIGREAARLGVPVRRVALVDARPTAEQRTNPYVAADLMVLDDEQAGPG